MKIGIIGGSGFYALSMLTDVKEEDIDTPFGKPSAPIVCGKIGDNEVKENCYVNVLLFNCFKYIFNEIRIWYFQK